MDSHEQCGEVGEVLGVADAPLDHHRTQQETGPVEHRPGRGGVVEEIQEGDGEGDETDHEARVDPGHVLEGDGQALGPLPSGVGTGPGGGGPGCHHDGQQAQHHLADPLLPGSDLDGDRRPERPAPEPSGRPARSVSTKASVSRAIPTMKWVMTTYGLSLV